MNELTIEDANDLRELAALLDSFWGPKMPGVVTLSTPGGTRSVSAHHIGTCERIADAIERMLGL